MSQSDAAPLVDFGAEGSRLYSVDRVNQVADDNGRRDDPVAVGRIDAVESEQRVQVHDAAQR